MNHNGVSHGCAVARQELVVLTQGAIAVEPAKGALDHPTAWQQDKAFCSFRAFDNVQCPISNAFHPGEQPLNVVASIGPNQLQARMTGLNPYQDPFGSILLWYPGGVNDDHHHQAKDID